MCGFVGGVFRRPVTEEQRRAFLAATRTLAHRGPDAEGVTVVPQANTVLGFRRLAIIDLATGDQPMSSGAGQHIIFNGEIYNYADVRPELVQAGVPLRTRSDTEVLLWRLARHGIDGLAPLVGMFGFAFIDESKRTLLLARDRLGIKQVYYTETRDGLFFASEPKALVALPWIGASLDQEQLPAFFGFRAVPAPNTLFEGIKKLPAGGYLKLNLDTFEWSVDRYWRLPEPTEDSQLHIDDALDRLEAAFLLAVRRRLVSDVPVGAFLSGGLDSSLVVAAMRRLGHPDLRTFCATLPGHPDDEAAFARRVSRRFGTRHYEYPANPGDFAAHLPAWATLNDDLVADASALLLQFVSQMARDQGCIVMLSGEGSDELFAGYGSYHKFKALHALSEAIPGRGTRTAVLSALSRLKVFGGQDRARVSEYLVRGGGYMGTAAQLGPPELAQLLPGRPTSLPRARGSRLADLCAFDFIARIPEDLLVRTDRATMGASIEARVPFLDHHLVELAFALPERLRAVPGVSKVLPRMLAARWGVPFETIVHRKIGFHLPIGDWFRGPMRGFWADVLERRRIESLNYDYVGELFAAHQGGAAHFEEVLWRVASLELWYRRWVEGDTSAGLAQPARIPALAAAAGSA